MADQQDLRPPTQVLTRGFDPSLSVGSARPAVFRSSTYVFPSPEAAERAFDLMAGRAQPDRRRAARPDLFALQSSQRRDSGRSAGPARNRSARGAGFQLRHGRHHDRAVHLRAARPEHRLHGPDLRRHAALDPGFSQHARHRRHSRASRTHRRDGRSHSLGQESGDRPD